MKIWRRLRSLRAAIFGRARVESELEAELRFHVEAHAEDLTRAGLSREEAMRQARLKLGGLDRTKEECRDALGVTFVEWLIQDARFGLRMLRKNPGFTVVAVITLALGIGANTAIFSVVNAALLQRLPYKHPDHIVWATERFPFNHDSAVVVSPDFIGWKDNDVFSEIGAFAGTPGANLTGEAEPQRVSVTNITTNFFQMLGIRPLIGRAFIPSEGKQAESHVALLNETLWKSRFGADRHIVGRTIELDGTAYTVVGVMPGGIRYPRSDVWVPFALDSDAFSPHSPRWLGLTVLGRLKPGITIDEARANLQVLTRRMDQQYPPQASQFRAGARADVVPLHDVLVQNVRSLLLILVGTVGLVLLIACANVANLLLSRAAARGKEMAVRTALGAGRGRLVRQALTESLLLGVLGTLAGLAAGFFGTSLLRQLIPPDLPAAVALEWRTFAFATALAIVTTALFGSAPVLIASSCEANEVLKYSPAKPYSANRFRCALVIGQIGLSLVLLSGAGLLTKTFLRLSEVHLGFEPSHLLLATVQRPLTSDLHQQATFFQQALDGIRTLPGVQSAAAASQYPLGGVGPYALELQLADGTAYQPGTTILMDAITPEYFTTLGIPLLKGRFFNGSDSTDDRPVAILSESLARQAFRSHDPLGQHFAYLVPNGAEYTVIGVVGDTRNSALDQEPLPEMFMPYLQQPHSMTFLVRTKRDPGSVATGVRSAVFSVDKNQPISELQTMDHVLATAIAPRRFRMLLVGLFALLALALATVGVYGVMMMSISQRTHEIGIRVALGAQRRDVMNLVLGQGALLAVGGVAVGVCAALWLMHYASTLLFGVTPTDPLTFCCASIVLIIACLLAAYLPARTATKVDPMTALRYE